MAIMLIFTPKLSKKFGKKELCGIGTLLSSVTAIIMYFTMPMFERGAPKGEVSMGMIMYLVFTFIIGIGYSFVSITTWAIVTDVIDYQEYKTGIRNESAIYAVYTFARKVGQTIADSGGLQLLYKYAKYDPENSGVIGYIPGVGDRMYKMVTRVMAVGYFIIFLLFLFYPLNKKNLAKLQEELNEKRNANYQKVQTELQAAEN
jgi:GPH family glycoside/pentoside/hexuronide:cation symporter